MTPKDIPRDIGGFIRDLRRNAKISLRQLAAQAGVSNPYLSQVERGLRKPSAEVLQQLASALRVSTPVMYLRAGLLDDKDGPGVLAAIAADEGLTMAQKQSLSQIYETFRRENARLAEAAAAAADASAESETTDPQADSVTRTDSGPQHAEAGTQPESDVRARPEARAAAAALLESVAVAETGAAPAPGAAARAGAASAQMKNHEATGEASGMAEQPDPAVEEEKQ